MFFIKNIAIRSLVTHITDYINLCLPAFYYMDIFTDKNTLITQLTNTFIR